MWVFFSISTSKVTHKKTKDCLFRIHNDDTGKRQIQTAIGHHRSKPPNTAEISCSNHKPRDHSHNYVIDPSVISSEHVTSSLPHIHHGVNYSSNHERLRHSKSSKVFVSGHQKSTRPRHNTAHLPSTHGGSWQNDNTESLIEPSSISLKLVNLKDNANHNCQNKRMDCIPKANRGDSNMALMRTMRKRRTWRDELTNMLSYA